MTLQVFPNENCGVPDVAVSSEPPHSYPVMKKPTNILSVQRGFSLVELLVVIAVIAIIAAIAIPNIANITGAAGSAKDQRNAQNIASVSAAARAAGWVGGADEPTMIASVTSTAGVLVTNTSDTNQVMTFRVDSMSAADISNARLYLGYGVSNLIYVPSRTNL